MAITQVVAESNRIGQRGTYGDLQSVLTAAGEEHEAGRLPNALAMYREALGIWLRYRWVEISGKPLTGIVEAERFLEKLRSGCHIDRFTKIRIQKALGQSSDIDFVASVVSDFIEGGAVCQKDH